MDMVYKFAPDNEDLRLAACTRYQILKGLHDSGTYHSDEAVKLKYIAYLAATAPDEPSEIIPGFTNQQTAWFVLSATYATYEEPMTPPVPFYHYCAGTFDEYGFPTGLQFSNSDYMIEFAFAVPSFQSLGEIIDGEAIWCDDPQIVDVPYDDHLSEIVVPVFYVGAAGGFGEYGVYTTTLLGSSDVSSLVVERLCGDVNCDGQVNFTDVWDLWRHVLNPSQYPVCNQWGPDVNCDGQVNFTDVICLYYHVVSGDPLNCCQIDTPGEYGHIDLLYAGLAAESMVWKPISEWLEEHIPSTTFDTGPGGYPSIAGTHKGTFTPKRNLVVERMYTYPCSGTGGHSEYVAFYNPGEWENPIAEGEWDGYRSNYHYINLDKPILLHEGVTYNYKIQTGSYPQIHHQQQLETDDGIITCTEFVDVNGKIYSNRIPAIRLEADL